MMEQLLYINLSLFKTRDHFCIGGKKEMELGKEVFTNNLLNIKFRRDQMKFKREIESTERKRKLQLL